MKKLVSLILALTLFAGVLIAPASAEEPVELSMFINFSWIPDSYVNLQGTRIMDKVTEKTGVTLIGERAKTDESEQLNLMLASGDLPDLICVDMNSPIFGTLSTSNQVMDLMPLIEEYAPEFYDLMGEGYWNFYKSSNGVNNYYANCAFSPSVAEKYAAFGGWCSTMAVREDIYEEFGSPALSTPEELLEHLRAVREKYPDLKVLLNGDSESLSLTGRYNGLSWWKTSFGIETYYEKEDGSVVAAYQNPKYPEAIKFINDLFNEGFLTREDLANTDESIRTKKESGQIYMMLANNITDIKYPPAGNPDVRYVAAPVFDAWMGTQQGGMAWCATFISKSCKDPEAAIKLMYYLATEEGDRLNQWGIEGEDYEYDENGSPVNTEWYKEQNATSSTEYTNARGNILFSMNWGDHEWTVLNVPNEEEYFHQARAIMQDHYFCRLNFLGIDPTGNTYESLVLQQCNDAWYEMMPAVIMAPTNEEALALFEELKATLEALDIAALETYWTQGSNKIKEAFGADNMILHGADSVVFHELYGE